MKVRKIIVGLLVTSLIGAVAGFILTNSTSFQLCAHNQYNCREMLNNIGDPLLYGMSALAFVFLLLYLVPSAFSAWKKFAIWFVPLAAVVFLIYPEPGSGDLFSPYPEQVFQWVSALYVLVSVIIIARVSYRIR